MQWNSTKYSVSNIKVRKKIVQGIITDNQIIYYQYTN